MLRTKSMLAPITPEDGKRISVMSRHTLEDGITRDSRITPIHYEEWITELAPPSRLVGDYYKRKLSWKYFEIRYIAHLRREKIAPLVRTLAYEAVDSNLTILCIEESPQHCHRRLLAEECQRYDPVLSLKIA